MLYRGYPQRNRRYTGNNTNTREENQENNNDIKYIPFPDELEVPPENTPPKNLNSIRNNNQKEMRIPFLDSLKLNFRIDDLILLGMVFLLINDNPDDDFLIIILLYLLISGRDA